MSVLKYALCKHGPRHGRPDCGFAHKLGEVVLPLRIDDRMWSETADLSGIDFFVGQEYTLVQTKRILAYVANEDEGAPALDAHVSVVHEDPPSSCIHAGQ